MSEAVLNGLMLGGVYALMALGLSLIFGVLRLINLAHGELVVGGSYLAFFAGQHLGLGPFIAAPIVVIVAMAIAYLLQRGILNSLLLRGSTGALVGTFGISLLIQGALAAGFSFQSKSLQSSTATTGIDVFGVRTRQIYVVAFVVGALLCAVTHLVLTRTRVGAVVRAAAADPVTAGLMGINVRRVYALTFSVAAGIAALSGVLVGTAFGFTPSSGAQYLVIGIAVVVLGGVGDVLGTFLGAIGLGLVQSIAAEQFGGGYRDLAVYILFFAILVTRPQGLLSRKALG